MVDKTVAISEEKPGVVVEKLGKCWLKMTLNEADRCQSATLTSSDQQQDQWIFSTNQQTGFSEWTNYMNWTFDSSMGT